MTCRICCAWTLAFPVFSHPAAAQTPTPAPDMMSGQLRFVGFQKATFTPVIGFDWRLHG